MSDPTEATILLAEEHDVTRAFLQDNLRADGYRVPVAPDRAKALAVLSTAHPDLIVVDVNGQLERPAPTHPLLEQIADNRALIGVQGPEEVLRVVLAAYRTFAAGRDWDPSAGTTTLDAATVAACARLGGLIWEAGVSDFEHGIQPGPVFHFDGGAIGLDLRFGDPGDDGRAVEAIAEGFAELGCTLGGPGGAPIVSGGS